MQNASKAILALTLLSMVLCSWFALLDLPASKRVDAGLKRALITFATARALNAVISVAQGTEVAVEPMGVGVNLAPGQLLDPINDLVEQFSTLMLAACIALGVQKMLISIGGYWLVSLSLTVSALGWAWSYFRQKQPPGWLSRVLVILLMVRFAIPMVTIGTDLMFKEFMASEYQASQQSIGNAPDQITELDPPAQTAEPTTQPLNDATSHPTAAPSPPVQTSKVAPPAEKPGLWAQFKQMGKDATEVVVNLPAKTKMLLDVNTRAKTHFKNLQQTVEQWTKHIINLIVIFLLQTLVIPLLLIWAFYAIVRGTFELPRPTTTVAITPH
jgi:hypothetical protein